MSLFGKVPYKNHGRRHALGGSDEIPGLHADYVFLSEITVAVDGDPIVFSSIDQTYRHLEIRALVSAADTSEDEWDMLLYWNGPPDGGGSYGYTGHWWWTATDGEYHEVTDDSCVRIKYVVPGATDLAGEFGSVHVELPYYSLSSTQKNAMWRTSFLDWVRPSTTSGGVLFSVGGGVQDIVENGPGDPITQVTLDTNNTGGWAAGSRASLYGIR